MLRSLYSAISGLRNHQARMDVIGNNIANVNTYGFKSSRTVFQEVYNQTLKPATSAAANRGGINAMQIGLGMSVAAIDIMINGASPVERTDRPLDLALDGEGFFVVNDGSKDLFTRAGNFYLDNEGNLVNSSGLKVMGKMLADAGGANGYMTIEEYTQAVSDGTDPSEIAVSSTNPEPAELEGIYVEADFFDINIDANGLIVGYRKGDDEDGTDGQTYVIGVLAVAKFTNPSGVTKSGNSLYSPSNNSGEPEYGRAGDPGMSTINTGSLEMSNVDLSKEFTDMIVTQRGFQANSRVITVSDTLLEELINLKR